MFSNSYSSPLSILFKHEISSTWKVDTIKDAIFHEESKNQTSALSAGSLPEAI
jgi:hypothetical protein